MRLCVAVFLWGTQAATAGQLLTGNEFLAAFEKNPAVAAAYVRGFLERQEIIDSALMISGKERLPTDALRTFICLPPGVSYEFAAARLAEHLRDSAELRGGPAAAVAQGTFHRLWACYRN